MRKLILLAALVVALPVCAKDPSLVGVWRFQKSVDTRADGSIRAGYPGSNLDGYVVYTSDGFVSVTLMPKARHWRVDNATNEQFRQTVEVGTAYSGRYEVDPVAHTVTHTATVCLDPADEGKQLVRTYKIDGDTLTLSGTWLLEGETLGFAITWRREKH